MIARALDRALDTLAWGLTRTQEREPNAVPWSTYHGGARLAGRRV